MRFRCSFEKCEAGAKAGRGGKEIVTFGANRSGICSLGDRERLFLFAKASPDRLTGVAEALQAYEAIPFRFVDVDLRGSMKIYTYSEARQNLATLLDEARRKGGVRIRRRDGESFVLRPEQPARSPFDVKGTDLGLQRDAIIRAIHKSRKK
jgi:hypothetical protein